jgi:hypothetical protein
MTLNLSQSPKRQYGSDRVVANGRILMISLAITRVPHEIC